MEPQKFNVAEANALLPQLKLLIEKLQQRQKRVQQILNTVEPPVQPFMYNLGSKEGSQLAAEFIAVEDLINKIHGHGCLLKDIDLGHINFLSEVDGKEVYLSWNIYEDEVSHYHYLEEGYKDRQPINGLN